MIVRCIRNPIALLVLGAALLASPRAFGQLPCSELVPQAMDVSGLDHNISVLTSEVRERVRAEWVKENMELSEKDRLNRLFDQAYNPADVKSAIEQLMIASCDPVMLSSYLRQLQTPLAQKMMAMEAEADTPEGKQKQERYMNVMRLQSPRESRLRLLDHLIDAMGATDFVAAIGVDMTAEMRRTALMNPFKPGEADQEKALRKASMIKNVELAMLYTYKSATDEELKTYIELYQSPAFRAFVTDSNKALTAAVLDETHQLALMLKRYQIEQRKARDRK